MKWKPIPKAMNTDHWRLTYLILYLVDPEATVKAQMMMHKTATVLFREIQSIQSVLLLWACGHHCWLLWSDSELYSIPNKCKGVFKRIMKTTVHVARFKWCGTKILFIFDFCYKISENMCVFRQLSSAHII